MVDSNETIQVIVTGHVQGVGFRYFVRQMALEHGVRGWVKNQTDGSVLTVAQGDSAQLSGFRHFLKIGPTGSRIDDVIESSAESDVFESFEIRF